MTQVGTKKRSKSFLMGEKQKQRSISHTKEWESEHLQNSRQQYGMLGVSGEMLQSAEGRSHGNHGHADTARTSGDKPAVRTSTLCASFLRGLLGECV